MGFKAVINFVAGDKYSHVAAKVARVTDRVSAAVKKSGERAKIASAKFKKLGTGMKNVGKKFLAGGAAIGALGFMAVKKSGDLEKLRIMFDILTGSVKKGGETIKKVIKFAASTPFQLEGVADVANGLVIAGFNAEQMVTKLRMLGDIASGTGRTMQDMKIPYLKAKGTGKVQMEVMNMFVEKNVPLWKALEKTTGKTRLTLEKMMTAGKISFKMFDRALASLTSNSGVFYKATELLSLSWNGLMSTFSDNVGFAMGAIGDVLRDFFGLDAILAKGIVKLQKFTEAFPGWAKENQGLVKFAAGIAAVVAVVGLVLVPLGAFIGMIGVAIPVPTAFGAAVAAGFWPFTLAVAAVMALIYVGHLLNKNWDFIAERVRGNIADIAADFAKAKAWIKSMNPFADKEPLTVNGKLDQSVLNRSEVNVNLNAPPGVIDSVETKTEGNTRVDTGEMLPAMT